MQSDSMCLVQNVNKQAYQTEKNIGISPSVSHTLSDKKTRICSNGNLLQELCSHS